MDTTKQILTFNHGIDPRRWAALHAGLDRRLSAVERIILTGIDTHAGITQRLADIERTIAGMEESHAGDMRYVLQEDGKTLMPEIELARLAGMETGAQRNVKPDWDASEQAPDGILHRPDIADSELSPGYLGRALFTGRRVADAIAAAVSDKVPVVDGKVPAAYLPSYMDEIVEEDSVGDFPQEGALNVIYFDRTDRRSYRWSGTQYVETAPAPVTSVNGMTGAVVLSPSAIGAAGRAEVEGALESLADDVEAGLAELSGRLQDTDNRLSAEVRTLTARVINLSASYANVSRRVERLEIGHGSAVTPGGDSSIGGGAGEWDGSMGEWDGSFGQIVARLDLLESGMADVNGLIAGVQESLSSLETDVGTLANDIADLADGVTAASAAASSASAAASSASATAASALAAASGLSSRMASAESALSNLRSRVSSLETATALLQQKDVELENRIYALENETSVRVGSMRLRGKTFSMTAESEGSMEPRTFLLIDGCDGVFFGQDIGDDPSLAEVWNAGAATSGFAVAAGLESYTSNSPRTTLNFLKCHKDSTILRVHMNADAYNPEEIPTSFMVDYRNNPAAGDIELPAGNLVEVPRPSSQS